MTFSKGSSAISCGTSPISLRAARQSVRMSWPPTRTVPPFPVHMQGPEKTEGRIVSPTAWLGFCFPFNMTGPPAVSLPAGLTADGLPVGLQIVGRHLADAQLIRGAAAFEAARPWDHLRPQMVDALDRA